MEKYLFVFILIPAIGFLINAFADPNNERLMNRASYYTMILQFLTTIGFIIFWLIGKGKTITGDVRLVSSHSVHFYFDYCFNEVTAVYLLIGSFLSFLIIAYSRTYLHREGGFKRFFTTIMLFYLAYNMLVLAGNLGTLFIGWELAGLSSFLLIGYYRMRYIPIKNAVKVFSIYRIGDLSIILALWISHHFYDHEILASEFNTSHPITIHAHTNWVLFYSAMIFIAASIKSAQFPFSSWLPRAMEGPTTSSAIFYSSLSVHLGVLLLLRTYLFWEHQPIIKGVIIGFGSVTFIVSTLIASVQHSIKGQIAYSSIAQIGLMFIEVALGWHILALVHFTGNALLRSYQTLVSPSIITYLNREQFYNFNPAPGASRKNNRLKNTLYMMSMDEFHLDSFMHHALWNFLKTIGKKLNFLSLRNNLIIGAVIFLVYIALNLFVKPISKSQNSIYAIIPLLCGLICTLRAFTEKSNVVLTWYMIFASHISIIIGIYFFANPDNTYVLLYLIGIGVATGAGHLALHRLKRLGIQLTLNWYQGHVYEHPKINLVFLLSSLGMIGFPITSAFLGIEHLYTYLETSQWVILFFVSLILLVLSLSCIRMYSRIFLGPHVKTYHEVARKSS